MSYFQSKPILFEVEKDRQYFRCSCGTSASFPFCDGSHAGTGHTPKVYQAELTGEVLMCACGKSSQALCDGQHQGNQ
jgi:CDGSH-type Zn-finger protein